MSAPSGRPARIARLTALVSGLVLFVFAAVELCNDAIGLVSLETMGDLAAWQTAFVRSRPGATLLAVACVLHVVTTLWFVARRATLRMSFADAVQIVSGMLIPLLLIPYFVDTRLANILFGVDDDALYRMARLWPEHSLLYVALIVLLWTHGCIGLHQWLKLRPGYRAVAPVLAVLALAVPIAAVAGLVASARVVSVLMTDDTFAGQVRAATHWPSTEAENSLWRYRLTGLACYGGLLVVIVGALIARFLKIVVAPKIEIAYVNGPRIKASTGPTLLEISRIHSVPHADTCGGRGRCTACSVRVEQSDAALSPRTAAEVSMLGPADDGVRLACQIRPTAALTVTRLASTGDAAAAEPERDTAGIERLVAVLCVQLQDHTKLVSARRAYDAIFLLNEILDMIHTCIAKHHGEVVRMTGSGIIALFGQDDAAEATCRAAIAASADIDVALDRLNERFAAELGRPIAVAMGLAFGAAYLGRIGAGPSKSFTAIGPAIDLASELAQYAEDHASQLLADPAVLYAGNIDAATYDPVALPAENGDSRQAFAIGQARLGALTEFSA
jgi:adenylate cyclase